MSLLEAIFMGIIQGLTEFLPVSSSGHLAIFKNVFDVNTDTGILYDVLLHVGTLAVVFVVYHRDIGRMIREGVGLIADACRNIGIFFRNQFQKAGLPYHKVVCNSYRKMDMLVLVSTFPTGVIGLCAQDLAEAASEMLIIPGVCLIVTAVLLFISDHVPDGTKTPKKVTYANAFGIGIVQGVATLPGLSRSGATISACLISGFDRNFAVKYSFLMSIPAILGAAVLELKDFATVSVTPTEVGYYAIGTVIAAIVGFLCMKLLLVLVRKKRFTAFAVYCLVVGVASVVGYFIMP